MDSFVNNAMGADRVSKMIVEVVVRLFYLLMRPMALISEVFHRKNFGERYFGPTQFLGGAALILMAFAVTYGMGSPQVVGTRNAFNGSIEYQQVYAPQHTRAYVSCGIWMGVFMLSFAVHNVRVAQWVRQGKVWHSESNGEPMIAGGRWWVNAIAGVLLPYMLYRMRMEFVGGLLMFSILVSWNAARAARRAMYHKVLDVLDAEIEAKVLTEAVEDRKTGKSATGANVGLPVFIPPTVGARVLDLAAKTAAKVSSALSTEPVKYGSVVEPKPESPSPAVSERPDLAGA